MIDSATVASVVSTYGIAILAPIAVLEGPIVTVIAAYLAQLGLLPLWQVILCVIIADLVGDCLFYGVGRGMLDGLPARLLTRLGITDARLAQMAQTFAEKGVRVLIIGKLTHAAGFAVLIGAGAARMRLLPFVLANLLATVPKSLVFVAIGYLFGRAHAVIGQWLSIGSGVLLILMAGVAAVIYRRRRRKVAP